MSKFRPGNPSISDTIRQLEDAKNEAERNLDYYKRQFRNQEEEISKLQSRLRTDNEKRQTNQLKRLKEAREQTAIAERKLAKEKIARKKVQEKYIQNLKKLAAKNRETTTALVPTAPITNRSGQKGFLTNMKKAMGMMMKRPATAFTALTAALAALGMTVIQQQQQLNQHRLDIQRIQNDYFNQLNKTNYYRDAFLGRAKIQTPSQYAGGGSVSRVLNSKNRAKHRKKIQDEANRIGPPPGKR